MVCFQYRIYRSFNGDIYGCDLRDSRVNLINLNKYQPFLNSYEERKLIKIIPIELSIYWSEGYLCNWFYNTYRELGFDDIAMEQTPKYNEIKELLGFPLRPDFLVKREGEWLRVEVENWVHKYYYCHPAGYADIIVAYADIRKNHPTLFGPEEKITYKKNLGVKELIHKGEIPQFLYLYNDEFKEEYDKLNIRWWCEFMGISKPPF